jgi:myo-inositol-1(or 4)-monophosphatase
MTTAAVDLRDLLALAESAAREAGRLLVDGRPADLRVASTKSSPTDVVTEMDIAAERLLVERLLGARPDDGVLGEEGASGAGTSGVRWVLDPIDGTVNYLYGLPAWAVSVAAEIDGASVVGVVHAPAMGRTWTALRGAGAFLDDSPVHCAAPVPVERALVGTGFGYAATRRAHQGEVLGALLPRVRDVRRIGSAAIDLCLVAGGQFDAYYERGTNRWDIAAGGLVATEAGVRVEGLHGHPASPEMVLAAVPGLFEPLHDLLASLDPARD